MRNWEGKGYLKLRPEKLKWSPFLVVKSGAGLEGEVGAGEAGGEEGEGLVKMKKTEAMGATGITGDALDLAPLKTNGLSLHIGAHSRGSNTPLSLFDDDNVVSAAEMEVLPELSLSTPAPKLTPRGARSRARGKDDGDEPTSFDGGGRTTRSSDTPTPNTSRVSGTVSEQDPDASPTQVPGRKRTKVQASDVNDNKARRGSKNNGVVHSEVEDDDNFDTQSRTTRTRSSMKSKKQKCLVIEDDTETKEEEEEPRVNVNGNAEIIVEKPRTGFATQPRVRGRFVKMSDVVSSPPPPPVTPIRAKPKQSRNRATAVPVASGDTGTPVSQGELQSVNGRRLGSPRKRRRVGSSSELDIDIEYPVASLPLPSDEAPAPQESSSSEEATAATSLLSLLHSNPPVVFNGVDQDQDDDDDANVKVEDGTTSRHSIPSDVTLFSGAVEKVDDHEQMDVDVSLLDAVDEDISLHDADADGSTEDDGEYDIDDGDIDQ